MIRSAPKKFLLAADCTLAGIRTGPGSNTPSLWRTGARLKLNPPGNTALCVRGSVFWRGGLFAAEGPTDG